MGWYITSDKVTIKDENGKNIKVKPEEAILKIQMRLMELSGKLGAMKQQKEFSDTMVKRLKKICKDNG